MRARTACLLALLIAAAGGAADQVTARVVRGGATNPPVEAGGHPVPPQPPPAIPHSLIGAIAAEGAALRWPEWPARWTGGKRKHLPDAPAVLK